MNPLTPQLRCAYRASGLTMAQIAARAEVSERTVHRALNGQGIHSESLLAICAVLSIRHLALTAQSVSLSA